MSLMRRMPHSLGAKSSGQNYENRDVSPDVGVTTGIDRDDNNSANKSPSPENGQTTPEARSRIAMKRVRYKANRRHNEAKIYDDVLEAALVVDTPDPNVTPPDRNSTPRYLMQTQTSINRERSMAENSLRIVRRQQQRSEMIAPRFQRTRLEHFHSVGAD